ncbi:hypothetical protein MRS44_016603 [Fusarium solani]|uniref:uncharacterized protein n=1 Tax=Fusarium solani TaxID=169388 RepID=UPI0032C3E51E|nr:hypothetical protein MRS44_016603 [Fusarium solani]
MQAQNLVLPCNEGPPSPYLSRGNNYATCHCVTKRHVPASSTTAQLGFNGRISRYPVNATLRCFVDLNVFQAKADGEYVAACFEVAPQAWSLGPVQLQRVLVYEDAFFSAVQSSGTPSDVAPAAAFFPNCPPGSCVGNVSPPLFTYREAMINTFCHELGHGHGLRHELPAQTEKDDPLIHSGFLNPESVMNYYNHPLEMAVDGPDIVPINVPYTYDANTLQGLPIDVVPPTSEPCQVPWKEGVQEGSWFN